MDGLEEEKYDLVLCSYQENRNNINFVPITTEELVVVVSKLNPLALKNEIDYRQYIDRHEAEDMIIEKGQ